MECGDWNLGGCAAGVLGGKVGNVERLSPELAKAKVTGEGFIGQLLVAFTSSHCLNSRWLEVV
jgi:hypothetical protein